jgi:hypothetical protein
MRTTLRIGVWASGRFGVGRRERDGEWAKRRVGDGAKRRVRCRVLSASVQKPTGWGLALGSSEEPGERMAKGRGTDAT